MCIIETPKRHCGAMSSINMPNFINVSVIVFALWPYNQSGTPARPPPAILHFSFSAVNLQNIVKYIATIWILMQKAMFYNTFCKKEIWNFNDFTAKNDKNTNFFFHIFTDFVKYMIIVWLWLAKGISRLLGPFKYQISQICVQ